MKRSLIILLSILLAAALTLQCAWGASYPCVGYTAQRGVNVRESTSTSSRLVRQVSQQGTSLTVLGETRNGKNALWYYVQLGSGEVGYVRSDLISFKPVSTARARTLSALQDKTRGDFRTVSAQLITGKECPAYAGPGTGYLRGANGKAVMSTNDTAYIYGREGGWLLVQYNISAGHNRFAYIQAEAVESPYAVPELNFARTPATLLQDSALTDDPLHSQAALMNMSAGSRVTLLAQMDGWAYIECGMARGFVPYSRLDLGSYAPSLPAVTAAPVPGPVLITVASSQPAAGDWRQIYRELLLQNAAQIRAYEQAEGEIQRDNLQYGGAAGAPLYVALYDITGDAVPELFFIAGNPSGMNGLVEYGMLGAADLHVYTVRDGRAAQLLEVPEIFLYADNGPDYHIFQTAATGRDLLMVYGVGAMYTYCRYQAQADGSWQAVDQVSEYHEYEEEVDTYYHNGAALTREQYQQAIRAYQDYAAQGMVLADSLKDQGTLAGIRYTLEEALAVLAGEADGNG